MISSLVYPVYLTIITPFVPLLQLDPILASLYGGLLAGVGIGLVLRTGASTGGMDIPPLIVNKYTGIKISTLVLITDALDGRTGPVHLWSGSGADRFYSPSGALRLGLTRC